VSDEITNISFNSDYFSLIKELTAISPGIIFTHNTAEKKIVINRTNKSRTVFFRVIAPEDYFVFTGEKAAFCNFAEFLSLIGAFGTSKLYQKSNKIIIDCPIGKINYFLSEPSTLSKSPSQINLVDPDLTFVLSAEAIGELKKVSQLMNICFANIACVEKAITLKLFNSAHENSFDKQFTPETIAESCDNFDFPVYSEIFSRLPTGVNYKVDVYKQGYMIFSFQNKGMEFFAITARVKKLGTENGESAAADVMKAE
jgi:hypothetical protein